ncbi:50S ribosomal protein L23 [Ktedonospora formicarum]|uniref:Large ribosomal subunit protein uL23 n=1 Tax=Ktedonospora formicarum TaxID=2778364 RepID=A0A8J3I399_9CHLR|nr:50S ribosomal protein L23 [Ktedonospora formicarum]GHO44064.1 50S ribosomal protein L23 [Ktedonospora formicarum]
MEVTEILRRGILTEKTVRLQEQNQYTFEVAKKATKVDIRRAVETVFNVQVKHVNVMRMPGKPRFIRRRGAAPRPVAAREWKKAIVTLKEGQTIDAMKA